MEYNILHLSIQPRMQQEIKHSETGGSQYYDIPMRIFVKGFTQLPKTYCSILDSTQRI